MISIIIPAYNSAQFISRAIDSVLSQTYTDYEIIDNSMDDVILKPGMVIAIEPMVNVGGWKVKTGDDGFTILTADNSLSAHFEHSVAVTEKGCEVLTVA